MSVHRDLIALADRLRGRADSATEANYGDSFDERLKDTISLADHNEGLIGIENLMSNLVDFEVNLTSDELADVIGVAAAYGLTKPLPTRCQKVLWHHSHPTDPIELWSEIDLEGLEIRKFEKYHDGHWSFANQNHTTDNTQLGTTPIPPLAAINADPQFEGHPITAAEFDQAWRAAAAVPQNNERWTVQASWQVGGQTRSYTPVITDTAEEAQQIASEMEGTLSHFKDLTITITNAGSGPTTVNKNEPAVDLAPLHILGADGTSTLCGRELDTSNAGISPELLELSTSPKCETCLVLLPTRMH